MQTETILVPLDGSAGSEAVLPLVDRVARLAGARVRLLHVARPVDPIVVDGRVVRYADQELARIRNEARAYLMSAAAVLGVEVELVVRFGDPAQEIVGEAERTDADVVAMATRRWTGLRRLLEPSVAARVKRATRIPVLLVPYGEHLAA